MKNQVAYKCRTNNETFESNFEFDSQFLPKSTNIDVIEFAMKDSISFCKFGLAGIEITSITLLP